MPLNNISQLINTLFRGLLLYFGCICVASLNDSLTKCVLKILKISQ
jgi:hypothetical protein